MDSEIRIPLTGGTLILNAVHERAVRVRFVATPCDAEILQQPESLIIVSPKPAAFTRHAFPEFVEFATSQLKTRLDSKTGALSFADALGNVFLREAPLSRKIFESSVQGEPCFAVEQGFDSPEEEVLHGLGQFQDGHFNLRGVTRQLIQVNTQIAIPFYLSSRGYGLLWHQYGLTDFNPADNEISLNLDPQEGPEYTITVTGSTGEFTATCRVRTYTAEIEIPKSGTYSFFLNYGEMTNRHGLEVDGVPVIRQENFWLPPAVDIRVKLTAGKHRFKILATKGNPRLFWRAQTASTSLRSPHATALDYVVFAGPHPDEIIGAFREITGSAPLLPRWAYGFWQCRERYETQTQLIENAREYRSRRLPVDGIVQDWQYWPKNQWAGMQFDPERFPDPSALVETLHELHLHLILSVWENVSKDSDLGRFYESNGYYVPDSPWLDATSPDARAAHWNAMERNFNRLGIAGWWLDATEPENDALAGKRTSLGPGELHRLTYPLYVCQAVAEGQRAATPDRRVCILTRSAFPGQQRYNSIAWSGDVGSDWDAFRRQIVAGLNYCASGLPYWTTDIGGFFRPEDQYQNPAYHEILTRWLQFGVFNPIFRIHGFGSETELWRFGPVFEKNARHMLDLRYRLLPYLYSEAWQVTSAGATFMRPVMWDFPDEPDSTAAGFPYLFGRAFLVVPVTEPAVSSITVQLPRSIGWYDFWTGKAFPGGIKVEAESPLERIPLFVRAGSIIPLGPFLQYTSEKPADPIELRVYPGANGRLDLYEDAGDGHGYEQGEFSVIPVRWHQDSCTLTLETRQGSFPGMLQHRTFRIIIVSEGHGIGTAETASPDREILYNGQSIQIPLSRPA